MNLLNIKLNLKLNIILCNIFLFFSLFEKDEKSNILVVDENPYLKNIDPKMVEMIKNEIIECKNPITWDDISGLEFAKNTIQVYLCL